MPTGCRHRSAGRGADPPRHPEDRTAGRLHRPGHATVHRGNRGRNQNLRHDLAPVAAHLLNVGTVLLFAPVQPAQAACAQPRTDGDTAAVHSAGRAPAVWPAPDPVAVVIQPVVHVILVPQRNGHVRYIIGIRLSGPGAGPLPPPSRRLVSSRARNARSGIRASRPRGP